MKIYKYKILIAILLKCTFLFSQNGQYISENYLFYNTNGSNQWTPDNPMRVNHKYTIDISISGFNSSGEIVIKDLVTNSVVIHKLFSKEREYYDKNTEQYCLLYSGKLEVYGSSQLETVNLIMDAKTNQLNSIVTTSLEYKSKGNYLNIYPVEDVLNSTGSGFIISNEGFVITNYHVIKGAKKVYIRGVNGNIKERKIATIINYDVENDIALLKIQEGNYNANFKILKTNNKEVGDNIFILGYPMISEMGTEIKLTTGIINSLSGYLNNKSYYQISAQIQPGNSGCPLFDSNGNLIGLITSKLTNGENVGYALKSSYISDFLISNGVKIPFSNVSISNYTLQQKVRYLKTNIISIESLR